jgi:hypothetical protein
VADVAALDLVGGRGGAHAGVRGTALLLDNGYDAVTCLEGELLVGLLLFLDAAYLDIALGATARATCMCLVLDRWIFASQRLGRLVEELGLGGYRLRTNGGMSLLTDNQGALDNGGTGVVDAVKHRLRAYTLASAGQEQSRQEHLDIRVSQTYLELNHVGRLNRCSLVLLLYRDKLDLPSLDVELFYRYARL